VVARLAVTQGNRLSRRPRPGTRQLGPHHCWLYRAPGWQRFTNGHPRGLCAAAAPMKKGACWPPWRVFEIRSVARGPDL